jgi:hypothetical protein
MNHKHRVARLIRASLLATVLTAGGALVAYASLPSAAEDGHATAAGNFAANSDRLDATLNDVLDRLKDGHAADAAVTALQNVIDRLGGDIGLNRAADAINGDTGGPDLPDVVANHPGRP